MALTQFESHGLPFKRQIKSWMTFVTGRGELKQDLKETQDDFAWYQKHIGLADSVTVSFSLHQPVLNAAYHLSQNHIDQKSMQAYLPLTSQAYM